MVLNDSISLKVVRWSSICKILQVTDLEEGLV